ncbi:MAG: hypothetical protein ACOX5R_02430 [bacterium]|jgi:hypothetical protein
MKYSDFAVCLISAICLLSAGALAAEIPVPVEETDVIPLTDNIIIHERLDIHNGGRIEGHGIDILSNGNLVICFEDDPAGIGAAWTIFDISGNPVIPELRGVQRPDLTEPALSGMFAPRIKANPYGEGFLFGVTYFDWVGKDNPQNIISPEHMVLDIDDAPLIQVLNEDGSYARPAFCPLELEYLQRPGAIWLTGVGYLSDGNLAVAYRDRQVHDETEVFNLEGAAALILANIVSQEGKIVHAPVMVQDYPESVDSWYGLAAGKNAFGVHYESFRGNFLRFYDLQLKPLTPVISLGSHLSMIAGRGDTEGWCANVQDTFLFASAKHRSIDFVRLNPLKSAEVHPARLDRVTGDIVLGQLHAAMDAAGNYAFVYEYHKGLHPELKSEIVAEIFDAQGEKLHGPFYVSSIKTEEIVAFDNFPKVAFRDGILAVIWRDRNTNLLDYNELALRVFRVPLTGER